VRPTEPDPERGFILIAVLILALIPLALMIGAGSKTMIARQTRLGSEVGDERALVAAESGIDYGVFRASTPLGLVTGTTYARDLGGGMSFTMTPTFLRTDGEDNDGDGFTDEADETIYRVLCVGTHGTTTRRVVAYLGPQPGFSSVAGALSVRDSDQIQVQDLARISGDDLNMNGTAGSGPDVPGIALEPPTTVATAMTWMVPEDHPRIQGSTPAPSVAAGAPVDWSAMQMAVQNAANLVLTSGSYKNYVFGNGPAGQFHVAYRKGNLQFQGNCRGAGVLFVTGDLQAQNGFRFDGIVFVGGKVQMQENAAIYGALICDSSQQIQLQGSARLQFSTQAVTQAGAALPGKYVLFNGWQEISRQ
jgi:hypothetical protein